VRLDHLLSKEHIAVCGRMSRTVAHGWNVDYSARLVLVERVLLRRGKFSGDGSCRARCWVLRARPYGLVPRSADPSELRLGEVGVVGGWSLLENCTVDASICGQVFKGARWMPWH
jgi:hypothetical protein